MNNFQDTSDGDTQSNQLPDAPVISLTLLQDMLRGQTLIVSTSQALQQKDDNRSIKSDVTNHGINLEWNMEVAQGLYQIIPQTYFPYYIHKYVTHKTGTVT